MNSRQELENRKQEYLNMKVPEEGLKKMMHSIEKAKKEKRRIQSRNRIQKMCLCAAAALMLTVTLPNVNANIAYAMGNIPLLGSFFRVVTFRDYHYDDENNSADVIVPQLAMEETEGDQGSGKLKDSAEKINLDIDKIAEQLIAQFKTSLEQEGGHTGLYINHEVVTDNDRWFTLRLVVVETQASSYEYSKYYTVDKRSGEVVTLGDLFADDSNYVEVISEEIKKQMREQMSADENISYFLDLEDIPADEFQQIRGDQSFYFNQDGNLTITFDEYEVAPGYMGSPEFVIGNDVIGSILKD